MHHVHNRRHLLELEVPGLAEKRPSVLRGDKIYVMIVAGLSSTHQLPEQQQQCVTTQEYEGLVHEVEESKVLLGFSQKLLKRFVQKDKNL